MKSIFKNLLLVTAALTLSAPAQAAENFSASQVTEIQGLIKDYITQNPEIIAESMSAYQAKQEQDRKDKAAEMLKKSTSSLTSGDSPSAGNPNGEIVVVEFLDYNCGYCKKALADIQAIVKDEKDVRVIFKEMPILGPSSLAAAKWALAAHKQGKYFEYHTELMKYRGQKNEKYLEKIAGKLGLNIEQMKKDASSKEVSDHINDDMKLARKIGIKGTPAFVIGDKLFPGYLGNDGLKREIESARNKSDK